MNRAERIFRLHQLLKERRPPSFERLRTELEVSPATLKRDIQYMREFMDAPIVHDRASNGYRYDPAAREFELPGLWFNDTELLALLASEQILEAVQPGLLQPWLGPLRARIRALLEKSGHDSDLVTSRILLQPVATRRVDTARFGAIAGAVLEGRVLELEYHGRERAEATRRRVHPYRLLRYRDNWYLLGWCDQGRGLRTFALDRVHRVASCDEPIRPADEPELERHLNAAFGIFSGEAKAWAILRFSPRMARWVADESWHPDQIGRWVDDEYELQVPYSDPRELTMDILKYGPEVEVVAPQSLRESVAGRIREAAARYGRAEKG